MTSGSPQAQNANRLFRASMYGSHPPPSDALIEASERELGVRLPPSYVALVRHRNGGHVRLNGVLLESQLPRHISDRRMYEFERIEGIQPGDFHSITEQTRLAREEWGVPDGLVAFDGSLSGPHTR
ncbi:MAG: SMI1/KNR4 family protein [Phycisphaerales bacterium]